MPYKKLQHISVHQKQHVSLFVCILTRRYLALSKGILNIFGLKNIIFIILINNPILVRSQCEKIVIACGIFFNLYIGDA